MKLSQFSTVALLILMIGALVSTVSAVPVLPHAFCGDVTVNGMPAPDGTSISATISEGTLNSGKQNPILTVGGSYGKGGAVPLLVQGEIQDGATITFYVNGVPAGVTAAFETGGGPTTIHLSVETDATPLPTSTFLTSTSASSGSGGSGSSEAPTTAPTQVPEKTVAPEVTESKAPVTHETLAPTGAATSAMTGTPSTPAAQAADQTPTSNQAPLVYAPIALIAGGIFFIAWRGRR